MRSAAITSEVSELARRVRYQHAWNTSGQFEMAQVFGDLLRDWRRERRMSQLDLGLAANVSARHIAFLETGRAAPSRSMVLQLAETMQVPRADRNGLLTAAGFAQAYRQRTMDDAELAPIRAAVTWTLERHDPYPAMALDRHWVVTAANVSATRMLSALGASVGASLLDVLTQFEMVRVAFDNWPDVARYFLARLRVESAQLGGDAVIDAAIQVLAAEVAAFSASPARELTAVMPTRLNFNGRVLSFFSTIAQFGTAEDIALADLRIELMFPADADTRAFLLS
jgi:transcriptional regulator with XRE-family HTH domain